MGPDAIFLQDACASLCGATQTSALDDSRFLVMNKVVVLLGAAETGSHKRSSGLLQYAYLSHIVLRLHGSYRSCFTREGRTLTCALQSVAHKPSEVRVAYLSTFKTKRSSATGWATPSRSERAPPARDARSLKARDERRRQICGMGSTALGDQKVNQERDMPRWAFPSL